MKKFNKNKLNITRSSLLITTLFTVSFYSFAAAANQVVSARYVDSIKIKQARSIEAGIKLGKLTPREASKLNKEQHEILSTEKIMRKDGALNATELSELFLKLQSSQKNINKLLRNSISTAARSPSESESADDN